MRAAGRVLLSVAVLWVASVVLTASKTPFEGCMVGIAATFAVVVLIFGGSRGR